MTKFTENIMKRVRNDWDAMIVITGDHGVGKSTLMQQFGFEMDAKFDQKVNISYIPTVESIIQKFNALDKYQVFGIDEAMEVMYKNDFMKGFQKAIIKMYARERKQNKITIMCIPSFADLSKTFRNSRVKYWIYVAERGHGVILCRPMTPYSEDAWNLKLLNKQFEGIISKKRVQNITAEEVIKSLKTTPYFIEEFWFTDLSDDKKEIYHQCVTEERDMFYKSNEQEKQRKPHIFIQNLIAYEKDVRNLSYTEIADIGQVYSIKQVSNFHKAAMEREEKEQEII